MNQTLGKKWRVEQMHGVFGIVTVTCTPNADTLPFSSPIQEIMTFTLVSHVGYLSLAVHWVEKQRQQ